MIVTRLIFFIILLAVGGGALAGTSLNPGNGKMMKCCKKASSSEMTPQANASRLCCAVHCADPAPTSSSAVFNFAPLAFNRYLSVGLQIASLLSSEKIEPFVLDFSLSALPKKFPAKYVQYHSFLI